NSRWLDAGEQWKARSHEVSTAMAELKEASVPDIGGYDDVPVIEVLVAVGDTVVKDQGLVTLESDKATLEAPAPFAGVVRELKVKLGDSLSEGSVVAMIEATEGDAGKPAPAPVPAPAAPKQEVPASETGARVEPVAVAAQPDKLAQREIAQEQSASTSAAATQMLDSKPGVDPEAAPPHSPPVEFDADAVLPQKVAHASPSVRLFARELGVDLLQVKGSERAGRISKEDVQRYVKSALAGGGAVVGGASAPTVSGGNGLNLLPWPKVDFAKFGEIEVRPLTRIKKISGANLARNWAMIPHVTQHDQADITGLEELRVQLNKENEMAIAMGNATKLTLLAFLIKASVAALKKFPEFNASLDATGENLVLKQYFHIGFAADTPNGLVVPVIRDCDTKG